MIFRRAGLFFPYRSRISPTQIIGTTPAAPLGATDVTVTLLNGEHDTLTGGFTFEKEASPDQTLPGDLAGPVSLELAILGSVSLQLGVVV